MISQGMTMLVETADQYFDIFRNLKEEVTTRELRPGYYDLITDDINLQEDEFNYPVDLDQEEEVEVVGYYTDIVTVEDRNYAHDSTENTSNSTLDGKPRRFSV